MKSPLNVVPHTLIPILKHVETSTAISTLPLKQSDALWSVWFFLSILLVFNKCVPHNDVHACADATLVCLANSVEWVWPSIFNLNRGQLPEQAHSDDVNFLINTQVTNPFGSPFPEGWFCYFHPHSSIIDREVLIRRGRKPQFLLLLLALQMSRGCHI